jgi:stage II sporulation protein P
MAYERSRRTVANLLKQQPAAVFDVHRDALPPEGYETKLNGQKITKVQLVVGKRGPTGKQIEDYALQIKAAADKQHPDLIKGIFFAKGGDYNQDLHPRSMLLEVGSHTNSREEAKKVLLCLPTSYPPSSARPAAPLPVRPARPVLARPRRDRPAPANRSAGSLASWRSASSLSSLSVPAASKKPAQS